MLGERFEEAMVYASRLHARQRRKVGAIPYVSHLLAVTATVLEHGGTEDEAIAALLHDAVEDQGGRPQLEAIRARFGENVAEPGPKDPAWLARSRQRAVAPPMIRCLKLGQLVNGSGILSSHSTRWK